MNRYDCESVRDLLPLKVRGQLLSHEAAAVELHVLGCGECREEQSLVSVLAQSALPVPTELEGRVLTAVRRPAPRRWAPGRLAMAATVAAAILGGALVLQRSGFDITPDLMPGSLVFDDSTPAFSWAIGDDPMLRGAAALHDLSMEELELVLAELDS
jgi:hypothetical protein